MTNAARAILIAVKAEAFLFDMDGVLIHSMPLHVLAWEQYLEGLGVDVDDLERRMHGRRNVELVWDFLGKDIPEPEAQEHGAAKERLFREMMSQSGKARYEIAGVIDFLERHRNVPKALASNAERANIDFALDHFGLRQFFTVAIDGQEVERPKPYPDIYLKAAARLGVAPERCLVFEDSPAGARAGIDAGMRVIGVESTPTEFDGVALKIRDFHDPLLEPWLASQMDDAGTG